MGPACTAVQLDSSLILFDFAHLRPVENTKDDAWRIIVRLCPVGLNLQNLARNLPCQSGRLRSMMILLLFWCFLMLYECFLYPIDGIFIDSMQGLAPWLTAWAQVENLVERKLHRIYVYLAAWFAFFYFPCSCAILVSGCWSILSCARIWLAYKEREYDGLVSGDMADAIVRRITKRRKQRHLGDSWTRCCGEY